MKEEQEFLERVQGRLRMIRTLADMNDRCDINLPDVIPHILRHTYCTRLAEAGIDIKVLQYLMGQTDLKTTMRVYNHVDINRVTREMERVQLNGVFTPIFTPNSTPIQQQIV